MFLSFLSFARPRFKKHGGIPSNPLDSKGLSRVQIHALHLKALEAGHLDLAQLMGDAARKPPLHEIEQKVLRTLDYAGLIKLVRDRLSNAREPR